VFEQATVQETVIRAQVWRSSLENWARPGPLPYRHYKFRTYRGCGSVRGRIKPLKPDELAGSAIQSWFFRRIEKEMQPGQRLELTGSLRLAVLLYPHGPAPPPRDRLRETARSDPRCLRCGTKLPKRGRLRPAVLARCRLRYARWTRFSLRGPVIAQPTLCMPTT